MGEPGSGEDRHIYGEIFLAASILDPRDRVYTVRSRLEIRLTELVKNTEKCWSTPRQGVLPNMSFSDSSEYEAGLEL